MSALCLPQFSGIDERKFINDLDALLQANLTSINQLLTQAQFTWDNLMQPLEDMDDALERLWSPLSHIHAVTNSLSLRECYQACLPQLAAYDAAIGQNKQLYNAIHSLDKKDLNQVQQKIVNDSLRDFELSGVALSSEKKQRFVELQTRLSELSNQFENNILDAGQAFTLLITDVTRLKGLPEHALTTAKELAEEKKQLGWMLNLEYPCFQAVVTYAEDRALREIFYHAFTTRASDQGPNAGQFDNSTLIDEILTLRHEKAQLLGFANYAEFSLATKMAESPHQVTDFLLSLANRAYCQATVEFNQLKEFATDNGFLLEVEPWDLAYLSEKMQQKHFDLSQEDLRPYFPQDTVMCGLFNIITHLYGMHLEEVVGIDTWHSDVQCYYIKDEKQQCRGYIYVDLFARQQKRGGAWMDSLQGRRLLANGEIQLPIATLTCNFAKPAANKMATFSHDEVITLFHEFGHCLHHLLTQVDYLSASGINGVEWDAVELPSQFFENWCWEKEALSLLTRHVENNDPMPDSLFEKLIAAKNFHSAMALMRQLEFSLFDFRLHQDFIPQQTDYVTKILAEVRAQTTVVPIAPYNRFQHSFSHIFAGGYAAGYYSYKWAEVLSSDAYACFEEEGIFNKSTGKRFLENILALGGSRKASVSFEAFRGRPVQVDALLRHNGIK